MNKYNYTAVRYHGDAQELLHVTRHKTSQKSSVAHQYTALEALINTRTLKKRCALAARTEV